MGRGCNTVLGILNMIMLVTAVAVMTTGGLYVLLKSETSCEISVRKPLEIIGGVLFFVSLFGVVGSCCCPINFFYTIYSFIVFIVLIGFIGFTVFAISISYHETLDVGRSNANNSKRFIWNHFVDEKHWNQIRLCLVTRQTCYDVANGLPHFHSISSSPVQSGCCKPPSECGFKNQNATFWVRPKTETKEAAGNRDCTTWSNHQDTLCYDCNSCKEGVVQTIRHKWKLLAIANGCFTLGLILLYSVGCCAGRLNSATNYRGYNHYSS